MFYENTAKYINFLEMQIEELCYQNKAVTFFLIRIMLFDFKTYKDKIFM